MSVPSLRFKSAQGHHFVEWSVRTLGQVCKINQGLQIPISERFSESGKDRYFYITNEFLRKDSDKQYFIKNPPASVLCNKDDILMTRTGNTGKVVTDVSGAFHNNFFKINYERGLLNKTFLCEFLSLDKTQSLILKLAGTSTIPDLNHGDFYKLKIHLPALEEQTKIANFLTTVDEKITQLTQKCELIAQYKKGVMQQIFSQELRFENDDGQSFPEWREVMLQDVLSEVIKKTTVSNQYRLLTSSRSGIYFQDDYFNKEVASKDSTGYKIIKKNQFTYRSMSDTGEFTFNRLEIADVGIVSPAYFVFEVFQGDSSFFKYFLNSNLFSKNISALIQGGTRVALKYSTLKQQKIVIPSLNEQTKIAKFFTTIDNKLTHTQNQLAAAKQYKQGLLQQMFV